ncbi:hypothetical protein [Streptomyces sp. NPDC052496]|uniref:hypothetical protein n=1 Tax=Streptomyces sp. NPDC052496 TaxID=3154951 RepID=UPI0034455721
MITPDDDAPRLSLPLSEPVLDPTSMAALRAPAVRRLLALRAQRRLTCCHVHTTAQCLNVSDRTVWRWLAEATTTPASAAQPGARRTVRFEITPEIRVLLAYWHGNASAVHRELHARARTAADTDPSETTDTPPNISPCDGVVIFRGLGCCGLVSRLWSGTWDG